jgi:hypothetical protein
MSDKITNENAPNFLKGESQKPKTVHMSPYSSFYGSSSTTSESLNAPSTTQTPQPQSNTYL